MDKMRTSVTKCWKWTDTLNCIKRSWTLMCCYCRLLFQCVLLLWWLFLLLWFFFLYRLAAAFRKWICYFLPPSIIYLLDEWKFFGYHHPSALNRIAYNRLNSISRIDWGSFPPLANERRASSSSSSWVKNESDEYS